MKNTQTTAPTSFLKLQLMLLLWMVFGSMDVCAQTTANFTINKNSGCVPLSSVNFIENSTGDSVTRRDWDLGNGIIIKNGNKTVGTNYLTAKTFYVTLTVTFSNGDIKKKTDSVVVHPKPAAHFEADDTAGCTPHWVAFTDRSSTKTGTLRKWTWDFGSGGTTVQNPSFVYNTAGNYNVSLIVENSWGCESEAASRFQYIRVYSNPVASFLPSATVSCNDTLTVMFNNRTTGGSPANKYKWYFGDGDSSTLENPSHFYRAAGTYTVTLIASVGNKCSATTTRTIYIGNVSPFFTKAPDTVCNNTSIQFSGGANPTPAYVKWIFSDNNAVRNHSPVQHSFASPGDYTVSLIAYTQQGCSDTITKPVHIKAGAGLKPFFITEPDTVCANSSARFAGSANPAPASIGWFFSDNGAFQPNSPTQHVFATPNDYNVSLIAYNSEGCADTITKSVRVKAGPAASFTPLKTAGCAVPFTIKFNNTSPGGKHLAYTWNFGDGSPAVVTYNTLPVSHTFTNFGNFTVTLTAKDTLVQCEGIATTFSYIRIHQPSANFTYVPPSGCLPLPVRFTANVNNLIVPIRSYVWNYGDGSANDTLKGPDAKHTYNKAGTFYPKVTIITAECTFSSEPKRVDVINICDDDGSGEIEVDTSDGGGGDFGIGKSCSNKYSVTFTDIVRNTVVKSWDFGDGSPLYTTPPLNPVTHVYSPSKKTYIVTVVRLDTLTNLTDTFRKRVIIIDEKAAFASDRIIICNNSQATFKTIGIDSSKIKTYTWDFGDSIKRVSIDNARHFNLYGLYLNGSTTHTYNKLGTFNVKLIIEDKLGCLDSLVYSKSITIQGPKANFAASVQSSCLVPIKVVFSDSSQQNGTIPIKNRQWSFGDGTPVYHTNADTSFSRLLNPGTYNVVLTVTDSIGCIATFTRQVFVPVNTTGPQAGFTATPLTSCSSPFPVFFKDTSKQNAMIPIVEWQWSFGDGTPDFITTADTLFSHIYRGNSNANFYTVTLKVKDLFGCVSTVTKSNYIRIFQPKANFTSNDTLKCGSYNVFLSNRSSAYNPSYEWNFGDGISSTNVNGSHRYVGEGKYDITLVVKDENGCTDSITKPSYIKLVRPVADFTVGDTTKCAPLAILFSNNSQYSKSYVWDFGDGGTGSTDENPAAKIYPLPGIYKITLKVKGLNECVDTTVKFIRVRGPIAKLIASTENGCVPKSVDMKVAGSFISTYAWDYNDGTPVNPSFSDSIVSHTYHFPGKYRPNVVLTSPEGCPFTLRLPDTVVVDAAKADFTFDKQAFCDSGVVTFSNLSVVPAFSSLKYIWDFGDGTVDTTQNPLPHLYKKPGKFTVKLKIFSQYGCVDSLVMPNSIVVNPSPRATIFGDSTVCLTPGRKLSYAGEISSADPVTKYKWLIDADTIANTANLDLNYRIPGNHLITLAITTANGCSYSTSKSIIVDSIEVDHLLNVSSLCGSGSVVFTNLTKSFSPVTKHIWWFGDGETSLLKDGSHFYTNPGNYTVKLFSVNQNGCEDSSITTNAVSVFNLPIATIVNDSVSCVPGLINAYSKVNSKDSITEYQWYVNNLQQSAARDLAYNFTAGNQAISLKVVTSNGCTDSASKNIIVDSVKANFSIANPQICGDTGIVRFVNLSASHFGNDLFFWDFGDGKTSTEINPAHFYATAGKYVVTLRTTTINGCTDTSVARDTVTIYKATTAKIIGESEHCAKESSVYRASTITQDRITSYVWKLNDLTISTADTTLVNFTVAKTYTLQLTVYTQFGCSVTDTKKIIARPLPQPTAGPDTTICRGATVLLQSSDGTNYEWMPSPTLQDIHSATPLASPAATTSYYVTVTNQFHCVQKDTVTIKVDSPVELRVSDNKIMCVGQKVQLVTTGNAASYLWSPAAGLNDITTASPVASPSVSTTYRVIAFSNNACKNDTGYVLVAVGNIPLVNAGDDKTIAAGTQVKLSATVNSNDVNKYIWTPSSGLSCTTCPDPTFTADKNTTYKVTVQTTYGCTASDEVSIFVFCNKGKVFIPDTFTPNHDGLNDRFYIKGYGLSKVKSLLIFNRWGQKVFEKRNIPVNDANHGWDGLVNGLPAESAAFVYLLNIICDDGNEFNLKGTLLLIK